LLIDKISPGHQMKRAVQKEYYKINAPVLLILFILYEGKNE